MSRGPVLALIAQFEFLQLTGDNPLQYSRFVGLREDKSGEDVVRERWSAEALLVRIACRPPNRFGGPARASGVLYWNALDPARAQYR